jgi:hypothetical protein
MSVGLPEDRLELKQIFAKLGVGRQSELMKLAPTNSVARIGTQEKATPRRYSDTIRDTRVVGFAGELP